VFLYFLLYFLLLDSRNLCFFFFFFFFLRCLFPDDDPQMMYSCIDASGKLLIDLAADLFSEVFFYWKVSFLYLFTYFIIFFFYYYFRNTFHIPVIIHSFSLFQISHVPYRCVTGRNVCFVIFLHTSLIPWWQTISSHLRGVL
jgi:hypothetical protein